MNDTKAFKHLILGTIAAIVGVRSLMKGGYYYFVEAADANKQVSDLKAELEALNVHHDN